MQGEFRGDFTRDTFNPQKNFLRVLMQQGRVQIDADWNEQVSILLHYLQTLTTDLIGPHGGPANNCGFEIKSLNDASGNSIPNDFIIGSGNYYVKGLLCQLESVPSSFSIVEGSEDKKINVFPWNPKFQKGSYVEVFKQLEPLDPIITKITQINVLNRELTLNDAVNDKDSIRLIATFKTQPYFKQVEISNEDNPADRKYLVYLDVWERHITFVEDENENKLVPGIREVALGKADTATRSQLIWQVKVKELPAEQEVTANDFKEDYQKFLKILQPDIKPGTGMLMAQAMKPSDSNSNEPCIISPEARYRGVENQLYRVEIHQGGNAKKKDSTDENEQNTATFKWSRENGSVIFPIRNIGGNKVTLENLGHDDQFGLKVGDWVEILDEQSILQGIVKSLYQVDRIDPIDMSVTLNGNNIPKNGQLLRRWEQKKDGDTVLTDEGTVEVIEDESINLENGIQILFSRNNQSEQKNYYATGDYWLIPARTATGDVEWSKTYDNNGNLVPLAVSPHGVEHHYAPLWIINVNDSGDVTADLGNDCRSKFSQLTQMS
jgi:hypothetical protein